MVVGRRGEGHHDGGSPGGGELGHGRRAGPADDQVSGGKTLRHVGEERRQMMADAAGVVPLRPLRAGVARHLLVHGSAAAPRRRHAARKPVRPVWMASVRVVFRGLLITIITYIFFLNQSHLFISSIYIT